MDHKSCKDSELSRREFIKGAVAGSAVLATAGLPQVLEAEKGSSSLCAFAELRSLPPGAVKPDGWVRSHMQGQARLASALSDIAFPFSGRYWEGEENSPVWFTWENKAYWIDGATRLAPVLGDDELLTKARRPLDYTLSHPSINGFLGPKYLEFGVEWGALNRWPNTILFRGLMALADAEPSPAAGNEVGIAEALRKHYLNDKAASYVKGGRNITNLEAILWCYGRTGDHNLLAMAQDTWDQYIEAAEHEAQTPGHRRFSFYSDLAPSTVSAGGPIHAHGVSYAETSKLPGILFTYTGKEEYRRFAIAAQRRVFDHHMLIDGIPSSSEAYAGTTALDEHETCDITDHAWAWIHLLMATGDGQYGDAIERACFNAHAGTTRTDWKGFQYFSSPNQFIATLNSDHGTMRPGSRRLAYQPNPAQFIGCCGGNKHRFFPNYVLSMWMRTKNDGLAATLYGPSTVTATVGSSHQQIQIVQKTNYPFEDQIRFEFNLDHPVSFPFALRIPGWCDSPQIQVNGTVTAAATRNGFAVLRRSYKQGDVVALTLPMKVKSTQWPNNGIGFERGPLVYALAIDAKWSFISEAAYCSEEFPTWEAIPSSEWNYGVGIDPANASTQVQVKQKRSTPNLESSNWPWADAPTSLTVPARRLDGWTYKVSAANNSQRFTPHLPEPGTFKTDNEVAHLTLVPYGATQLRMSIFPKLESE